MAKLQNHIRLLRHRDLISQKELAEALHVSQATISGWENGFYEPDQNALISMAKLFDVSVDYIMGLSGDEKSPVQTDPPKQKSTPELLSDIEFAIAGELHDLSDEDKLDVLDYVRFKKSKYGYTQKTK